MPKKLYMLVNVPDGRAADVSRSPLSGNPTIYFSPVARASRMPRSVAQAVACVLVHLGVEPGSLAIEEATEL